jgi:hypothetical protein
MFFYYRMLEISIHLHGSHLLLHGFNLSSSIAMVVFGRLASLSNSGGGADLLGAS